MTWSKMEQNLHLFPQFKVIFWYKDTFSFLSDEWERQENPMLIHQEKLEMNKLSHRSAQKWHCMCVLDQLSAQLYDSLLVLKRKEYEIHCNWVGYTILLPLLSERGDRQIHFRSSTSKWMGLPVPLLWYPTEPWLGLITVQSVSWDPGHGGTPLLSSLTQTINIPVF